jgi:Transposase domain (DUF772)
MAEQAGFFDGEERLKALSAAGDPLERLAAVIDFEVFRADLEAALSRSDRAKGGRPPYDAVLMFKVLILQTLYTLSDDQAEYQLKDRLSFMRFIGLALHDPVPDAKTIWLYREQLARAGVWRSCLPGLTRCCARRAGWRWRADHRCDGDRSTPPAADPGGEGHDQGRRHSGRVDPGATRPDRPRRALDHQTRQQACGQAGRRP